MEYGSWVLYDMNLLVIFSLFLTVSYLGSWSISIPYIFIAKVHKVFGTIGIFLLCRFLYHSIENFSNFFVWIARFGHMNLNLND